MRSGGVGTVGKGTVTAPVVGSLFSSLGCLAFFAPRCDPVAICVAAGNGSGREDIESPASATSSAWANPIAAKLPSFRPGAPEGTAAD